MSLLFPVHFLVGVALGRVVTWQLDRRRQHCWMQQLNKQLLPTPTKSGLSETQQGTTDSVGHTPDAVDIAGAGLSAASSPLAARKPNAVPPEPVPRTVDAPIAQDQLEQITGIGLVFATRLNGASSRTFTDLTALTAEESVEMVTSDHSIEKR